MNKGPRWKMAVIIWIAIYPLITIFFFLFGKYLMQIEYLPVRTLLITLIVVPIMVFILLPILTRFFSGWLKK